jgi:hypothetical protein
MAQIANGTAGPLYADMCAAISERTKGEVMRVTRARGLRLCLPLLSITAVYHCCLTPLCHFSTLTTKSTQDQPQSSLADYLTSHAASLPCHQCRYHLL